MGNLFDQNSVIIVRTRALFSNFCVAWVNLTPPPPHPHTIRVNNQKTGSRRQGIARSGYDPIEIQALIFNIKKRSIAIDFVSEIGYYLSETRIQTLKKSIRIRPKSPDLGRTPAHRQGANLDVY